MPKFSIVIPVYNVEDYIERCLESVKNQTFKDYEVIVVNDGTKDNSMEIVNKYHFKIINQENQGLSAARNNGAKKSKGEYILFLDSDDYLEKNTLTEVNKVIEKDTDLVRFQIKEVYEDGKVIEYNEQAFKNLNGEEAFSHIVNYHFIENAWCYAINRKYYEKEKFFFAKGTIHEDYGLIPLVIRKAKKVSSISYIGYNYVQRTGSIMNSKNYNKTKKQVKDFYNHYNYLIKESENIKGNTEIFKSYISNSLIEKICELKYKDYKKYKKKLKEDRVYDNLLTNTISRKIKKILVKVSPKIYFKIKG